MLVPPIRSALVGRRTGIGHHEGDGAEADDEGQDVEVADEAGRAEHRLARRLGVGDGEEAHQDVRQAGGAEHQRHADPNRDGISTETGLLKQWPADGPPLAWKTSGAGTGYSSLAIAERTNLYDGPAR